MARQPSNFSLTSQPVGLPVVNLLASMNTDARIGTSREISSRLFGAQDFQSRAFKNENLSKSADRWLC